MDPSPVGTLNLATYRQLFETMAEGVAIYEAVDDGADFVFLDYNPAGQAMDGVARREAIGRRVTDVFPGVREFGLLAVLQRVYRTGDSEDHPVSLYEHSELAFYRANRVSKLPEGQIIAVYSDETARRQAEASRHELELRLAEARHMEAVGQLAGGMAHGFNNALCAITAAASSVLEVASDQTRESLAEIIEAAEQAAGLTRRLLAFSQREVIAPRLTEVGVVLAGMAPTLGLLLGEHIVLETLVPPTGAWVVMDPAQLRELVVIMTANARDAMPDGGRFVIEVTRAAESTDSPRVAVSFTDTGHGMSAEVQARIFEPFYSTKGPAMGAGLGLAAVAGIVEQSGGTVEVRSAPGEGSRFEIHLPQMPAPPAARPGPTVPLAAAKRPTILVVDDEDIVRRVAVRVLASLECEIIEASSGAEALALAAERNGQVDLLLTDVIMPDLNGRDLAAQMVDLYPGIHVLFTSGYPRDVMTHDPMFNSGVHFVTKPYSRRSLISAVEGALGGGALA